MRIQVVGAYVEPNLPIQKVQEGNIFDHYDYKKESRLFIYIFCLVVGQILSYVSEERNEIPSLVPFDCYSL